MQKTLTFNGKKFEAESASSVGKLIQAIVYAPNRLNQAINFAVEAALYHTQANQLGPIKDLLAALVFSEHAALKKQGVKLVSYIKEEVATLDAMVAKKSQKVIVKYLAEEGSRDLPDNLPSFSSWELPKGAEPKAVPAVTEKAVASLTSKWAKREKALQEAGKEDELAAEKLELKAALMRALDELAPELELFKAEKEGVSANPTGDVLLNEVESEAEKLRQEAQVDKVA